MKETIASCPQGNVLGIEKNGISRFSAIPFAQAPIGPLRFACPVPTHWSGTLDATRPGPVCPQRPSRLEDVMGPFQASQNEDCLHLTVWTPRADNQQRPVLIWLHGGAYQSGGGAISWYDGSALARKGNLVVVSPNYRLGALGWLYVPGEVANLGILDQEAAIEWVIENIEAFGGDPEQITLMGQSAGGASIAALLARKPKFQRALIQSAALGRGFRPAKDAAQLGSAILDAAGVESLAAARNLSVNELLDAQHSHAVMQALQTEATGRSIFCPVLDGDILPAETDTDSQAPESKVNVLIGYTRNEMTAFPGMERNEDCLRLGQTVFGSASLDWAAKATAAGRQAWSYRFDYGPNPKYGACHCIELPFIFDTFSSFEGAPMLDNSERSDLQALTNTLQSAWINFIRDGYAPWQKYPYIRYFN